MYKCPNCKVDSIPTADKYKASYWIPVHCRNCGVKLSAHPLLLLVVQMIYVWNVLWFFGLWWYNREPIYFLYMALGWLVIDFLNVKLMPLAVMRKR